MNLYNLQQRYRAGAARRGQSGFTMVELAIVLVIAGIILVAALKGTDMINKAKIERTVSDIRGIQGMIFEHEKRVGRLPGDCNGDGVIGVKDSDLTVASLRSKYSNVQNPTDLKASGDGKGVCKTTADEGTLSATATSYTLDLNVPWNEMRKASIVDPNRFNSVLARNQTNDYYGIGSIATTNTSGKLTNVITVYNIPLWMAKGIDVAIDGSVLDPRAGGRLGRIRLLVDGTTTTVDGGLWPNDDANDQKLVSIYYQFDRMSPPK